MEESFWTHATSNRNCPLCGADDHLTISRQMQHGLNLYTVLCRSCSLVFTNPVPDRTVYQRFYTEAYSAYYGNIAASPSGVKRKEIPEHINRKLEWINQVSPLRGKSVLEIGPGQGLFLWWMKQAGANVVGIEPSPVFQARLAQDSLPYIPGSFEDLDFKDHYDIIVMFHVLEHFYDPNFALRRAHSILSKDGVMVIEVPSILKAFRSLDHYFLRYVHLINFSPSTLQSILLKNGFETVFMDEGGDDWRSPQNLFVIARKRENVYLALPNQDWKKVLDILKKYRTNWRLWGGLRYQLYLSFVYTRRWFFGVGRKVKHLVKRSSAT